MRTYRFSLTVGVKADHEAYDDPEWFADAAWGALSNEYGLRCTYGAIEELSGPVTDAESDRGPQGAPNEPGAGPSGSD